MRIGFFTDSYLPRIDGVATGVETYRAGLTKLGHEVFVFCPARPEPFPNPPKNIYRFPSIPNLFYEGFRDTFPIRPKDLKLIKSLNLDIIHTSTQLQIGIMGLYMAKKCKIPLVTTCNADFDLVKEYKRMVPASLLVMMLTSAASRKILSKDELEDLIKPTSPGNWFAQIVKTAAGFYNNQCDAVTVPSLKAKEAIDSYTKNPTIVIPLGTDLSLVPKKLNIKSVREKYKIPQDKVVFSSSSRIIKEKRIDFLIKAYSKLPDIDKEKSVLLIVGKGPHEAYLKDLVEKLGLSKSIIFTGMIDHKELFNVLSSCDIHVHASVRETQGLVLNEAAACGLPIIMIDREVNPVVQDGKNGFFAENNEFDFAKKMSKLLNDKKIREKFGKESKILAKATSQENVSRDIEKLYKSLISRKHLLFVQ